MSAQQTLHRTIYFCCYFSDALLLPIQVWFVSLKRECFKMSKQICTSVLRSIVSNFCSLWDERPLWFQHVIDAHEGRASPPQKFHGKRVFLWTHWSPMCILPHMEESVFSSHISTAAKGQVYICAHSNILSLEMTINSTFYWICLTILIATLSLTLLETSLWHNLAVHSPIFITEVWKGNGRTDKRNIYRVPTQATPTFHGLTSYKRVKLII